MHVLLLDTLARQIGGPQAAMTTYERQMIEAPLARTLQKYGVLGGQLSAMADPVMLAIGLLMWGSRVVNLRQEALRAAALAASQAEAPPATFVPMPPPGSEPEPPPPPIQERLGENGAFVPTGTAATVEELT